MIPRIQEEFWLKEYESLRTESLNSINNRIQITSLGLTAIGAILAGSLAYLGAAASDSAKAGSPMKTGVSVAAFGVAIPLFSLFFYFVFFGEVERMMRIGRYLQEFEDCVVDLLQEESVVVENGTVLGWENYIRQAGRQLMYPYLIPLGGFLSICALSPVLVGLVSASWTAVMFCAVPAWIACFLSFLFVLKKVDSGTVFDGIVTAHPWLRPIFSILPF